VQCASLYVVFTFSRRSVEVGYTVLYSAPMKRTSVIIRIIQDVPRNLELA
jgi:hypothetical protein